ncbi:MAG: RHS repeat-associated core domain-containing protein, partial [Tumebacillaceae bacterium]
VASMKNTTSDDFADFEYDQNGLRTQKITYDRTEQYYYNGTHLAYMTDENNKLRYGYTRDASGTLLTMTDYTGASPVNYFYVLDVHGNVIGLKDKTGNMVVSYSYDAFGNVSGVGTVTTGAGKLLRDENPFRYASYFYDRDSGLYDVGTRYYNPQTGRFITRDSVPTVNAYAYAGDNPVIYVDPTGSVREVESGYSSSSSYTDAEIVQTHYGYIEASSSGNNFTTSLDSALDWWNSRSNHTWVDGAVAGASAATGYLESVEKKVSNPWYRDSNNRVWPEPKTSLTTKTLPFKSLSRVAAPVIGNVLAAIDIGAIWVDPRLNWQQKVIKSGVVVAGVAAGIMVGAALAPLEGSALVVGAVGTGVSFLASWGIAKGQDWFTRNMLGF